MTRVRDYLDSYRLVRLIRAGHSSQVWEAVNEEDGTRYALKVLRPEGRNNREELGFLKHEFEVAHGFKHPNIIKILQFKPDGPAPYLVMELFNAKNMKLELREGAVRIAHNAPKTIEQSAEALYYLHTQGWIHCDVKPDNFLVGDDGFVKLIDFAIAQKQRRGLAKLFGRSKVVQGTRSYMSPEQIRGESLDPRADLYSFACVLFELVGGKPPFTGDSPNDLLNKHLKAPIPSVQVANSNVTAEFGALLRKMMAKNRNQRPESMWEFLKAFRALHVFHTLPPAPKPAPPEDEANKQT
jgi:serine/threonine protein kinase